MDVAARNRPEDATRPLPPSRRRRWAFRVAAVLLGLSPLLAFEGLCRLLDWGRPSLHDDPFVGFASVRPLFVLTPDASRYEIPPARQTYFRPESFAAAKADDEFRIFCLGGSTVQGRPFKVETSFTTWLEISLAAAQPSRRWKVINCGGVSYASYRLIPVLEEVLGYEPDLIILYTGHNEFLEARTFDHIQSRGTLVNEMLAGASRLRTFTLLREGYLRLQGRSSAQPPADRPILPTEVDALLDYRGGLEEYTRDEEQREGVIEQYRYNLRRMVEMARDAGVPMVLANPVSNFRNCPPFKSQHRRDMTPDEQARWQALCSEASRCLDGASFDLQAAIDLYEQACRLDPQHAGAFYNLAQCYEAAGRQADARDAFLQAKELDICPLRILQPMNDAVLQTARQTGTPLVDAQALFEDHSPQGIVGSQWLLDHVHPSIKGHELLADTLAAKLVELHLVQPCADWQSAKRRRYVEHFDALPELYFHEGTQRLAAVRKWARGRASRSRSENANENIPPAADDPSSDLELFRP